MTEVRVLRTPIPMPGLKPGTAYVFTLNEHSLYVRCPPNSSAAFIDGWSLPEADVRDGPTDQLLRRAMTVVRGDKRMVKVRFVPSHVTLHASLVRYGFVRTGLTREQLELTYSFL